MEEVVGLNVTIHSDTKGNCAEATSNGSGTTMVRDPCIVGVGVTFGSLDFEE